jgi:hypothetical protein
MLEVSLGGNYEQWQKVAAVKGSHKDVRAGISVYIFA